MNPRFRHFLQTQTPDFLQAGGIRGAPAGVQGFQFPTFAEIHQSKEVAAQAGHHRLHHVQGSRCGDGGINGIATLLQHVYAGLCCQMLT